ncbi:hypothetical protein, conserved, partial [Leishmania lindenbergi]
MLPPPEIKPPYELEMTSTGGGVKMVECTSVGPATNEARPAPEALPLPPVSGPSAIHYGRRRGSRPLCRCMKQRTNDVARLSCARLGHRCLGVFSAALIRYRERQRRELGIERFRREGLCAEESDAATLPPGDVLPPTDADTASDEQSDAATLRPDDVLPPTDADTALNEESDAATLPPVSGPSAIHYRTRRGSRPLCRCMKQRTNDVARLSCARLGHRCLGVFSAALIRYRERQRRELGIERFRREGLCAEESDAATLPPGDVLPPTDADT